MTYALSDSMVKACLFLLVAVAVAHDATCATSSLGCPSKMQADANTLLQTGVHIGDELAPGRTVEEEEQNTYTDETTNPHKVSWMQEGMNTQRLKEKLIDNSKGKGRRDVLIQLSRFVNTLGNATKHFNSSNADNLKEVINILRAVMYKSMNMDHTEDQTELNQAFAGITTCNTDLATAITDNVTPLKNTMVTARSTHTTCRSEEAGLETIKTEKWDDVNTHMKTISEPEPVTPWPAVPTYAFLVTYFSTGYGQWLVTQKQAFDTKKNAYVSANTDWTTSKDRCDRDQTTFESNFCVYNSVLDTTCLGHDTCHTSASSGAITTTARVKITEAARKDAYKAGEEIVCRINALLANRAYSECDNLTVNTSNYSIVYPTAENKDSCVKEAETPCSNTWKDTEYNGLPSNAPSTTCTPCQAPSMAPTVDMLHFLDFEGSKVSDVTNASKISEENDCSTSSFVEGVTPGGQAFKLTNGCRLIIDTTAEDVIDWTLSFWFKPEETIDSSAGRVDLLYGNPTFDGLPCVTCWHLTFGRNDVKDLRMYHTDPVVATNGYTFKAGSWYHVLFTQTKNNREMYINGNLESSGEGNAPDGTVATGKVWIGARWPIKVITYDNVIFYKRGFEKADVPGLMCPAGSNYDGKSCAAA